MKNTFNLSRKELFIIGASLIVLASLPLTVLLNQSIQKKYSAAAPTPGEYECRENIDLVVLFDMSVSMNMGGFNKLSTARESFSELLNSDKFEFTDGENNMPADGKVDFVGIVPFNDVEITRNPSYQTQLTSNKSTLLGAVSALTVDKLEGATSVTAALAEGYRMLDRSTTGNNKKYVLLFTDGRINVECHDPSYCQDQLGNLSLNYVLDCGGDSCDEWPPHECTEATINTAKCNEERQYRDVAQEVRKKYEIISIYFGPKEPLSDKESWGFYQLQKWVHKDNGSTHLIQADLNKGALSAALEAAMKLMQICPCPFTVTAQIKDTNGTILSDGNGFSTVAWINGTAGSPLPFGAPAEIPYPGEQIPDSLKNAQSISVELVRTPGTPAANYEVVGSFCVANNNEPASQEGCPDNLTPIGSGTPDSPNILKLNGFGYQCPATIDSSTTYTYGWYVQPGCGFSVTAEIRTTDGSPIPQALQFPGTSTLVTAAGQTEGPTSFTIKYLDDAQDAKPAGHYLPWSNIGRQHIQKYIDAQAITVTLNPLAGANATYGVVGTFCESADGNGCPTNITPPGNTPLTDLSLTGFEYFCGMNYTYGWYLKPPVTKTVCVGTTCQQSSDPNDPNYNNPTACTTPQANSPECTVMACRNEGTTTATCEAFPKDNPPGTSLCTNHEDCRPEPVAKKVCDETSCIQITDETDPRYNNRTCTTLGNNSPDCTVQVCVGSGSSATCEPFSIDDPPGGIRCDSDDDCRTHTECNDRNECVDVQGSGRDECQFDIDCLQTYYACDTGACVEFYGSTPSNARRCSRTNPVDGCLCDPDDINACRVPEDIDTGTSGAALVISLITIGLLLLGVKLLF